MKIGLIVEGDCDIEAVPILVRKTFQHLERYDLKIDRPIKCGSLKGAINGNTFIRYYKYLSFKSDIDQIAIILDCDEFECVVEARELLIRKILGDFGNAIKPTSISLLKMEFETIFIHNCLELSDRVSYFNVPSEFDIAAAAKRRDAKKEISSMLSGTNYKETIHQASFASYFHPETWSMNYSDLKHFVDCLVWHASAECANVFR